MANQKQQNKSERPGESPARTPGESPQRTPKEDPARAEGQAGIDRERRDTNPRGANQRNENIVDEDQGKSPPSR